MQHYRGCHLDVIHPHLWVPNRYLWTKTPNTHLLLRDIPLHDHHRYLFYLSPFLPLPHTYNFIPFLFTLIFSVLFSIGLGPIALLLPSELFPANVKAKASAVASICQAAAAFLSNIIWLDVVESVGLYMNFFIFAAVSLAFYVFSIFFFIETKGKTLEEIQDELNSEQRSKSVI
ncbi:solute carrier family 2, facilitated glucose transporter member 10-like [Nilaparvata lugens]|uniref:solute carrier family 2, facilitated glucose transporter member 10-like n=1 Tax=Nilaparvata lugens TaxID=108931 RepID=UPI00193D75E6|nr:solute carrier family 2, facilitated glucose transporter member 10-like [Nilaparvata lugens]